ncbi:MAG: phosphate acetyltransferase [Candidatus Omnitrophota bacterium]
MLRIISELRQRAKKNPAKIVLPEAEDRRVLEAASVIVREGFSDIILLGRKDLVEKTAKETGIDTRDLNIIDPTTSEELESLSQKFYEIRKHKGLSLAEAKQLLIDKPVNFAGMLVREKKADGFVAGAVHTTREVARAGLYCIGLDRSVGTMSSSFIMALDDESFGAGGVLVFADCGIVPFPSSKQLANIAISASDLMKKLFCVEPKTALLSFSTKGSGATKDTEKLLKALESVRSSRPDILIDGELQADSALVPEVAAFKAPNSPVGGEANVLIFPNLEAGNIAYKLTQRLAKARALGPLLHGILAPCSDLSRGCTVEDVIDIVCVTAIRANN